MHSHANSSRLLAISLLILVSCGLLATLRAAEPRLAAAPPQADGPLRIATFEADVTPPLGSPLCDALVMPAKKIDDPLSAKGIVILGAGKPIVMIVFDWIGIGNEGYDTWCARLAQAAGTTPDRVAVHATHVHDAPGCDFATEKLLAQHGLSGAEFNVEFANQCLDRLSKALTDALPRARPVTRIGTGMAPVQQVASNRRILGPDGKVAVMRLSSSRIPAAIAAPEGVIDPNIRLLALADDTQTLALLSYYATHPQSHYAKGCVSCDFVGLARNMRQKAMPGAFLMHFNGAGGNVAAGKYNDGSPERRPILTQRLADGMEAAFGNLKFAPLAVSQVDWAAERVAIPLSPRYENEEPLMKILTNPALTHKERVEAARTITWARRVKEGGKLPLSRLRMGQAQVLHMPGELFVEYQLAAQKMKPDQFICMAAYGDYGPGYICTDIAYTQGGYESGAASRTGPGCEKPLMEAMQRLLN